MSEELDAESYLKSGSNELRTLEYRVAGMSFGINILKVKRIISDLTNLIAIPQTHPAVMGVFRDMEILVPVIDLAKFLGIENGSDKRRKVIVTEFFGLHTGFLVNHIDWIHHFRWEDVIDANDVFGNVEHRYVLGIVRPSEDHMVQLLDYESILLELCPHLGFDNKVDLQPDEAFVGKRVLVAEDSTAVRSMLINELSTAGFQVDAAADGQIAWDMFQEGRYDLVISDIEMPQMDGLALTLNIRQSDQPDTPVIVYSSIGDAGMKARARYLKANAHITKLNLAKLIDVARDILSGKTVADDLTDEEPELESVGATLSID